MSSASVTRRALTLGARDSVTKWPAKTYAETTIKGSFDPAAVRMLSLAGASVPYTSNPFYTGNYVRRGDHIVDSAGVEYELTTVKPLWRLNEFIGYICSCAEITKPADRAATSGTWHQDSEALTTDPRNRILTWLNTYVAFTDGTDQAVFAGFDYPMIEREFIDNNIDVLVTVDTVQSTPEYTTDKAPYKFRETVKVHCFALDTATLTATNMLESYEQEVRNAATEHPYYSSLKRIISSEPSTDTHVDIGGQQLWQNTITMEYTRPNDDYFPTYPSVTWGPSAAATGTFIFPNVTYMSAPTKVNNTRLMPPGRMGNILQKLGMPDFMITLRCDLDTEPVGLTWKRPQTTAVKTDVLDWQVFLDIAFNGQYASTQTYQTLDLGWGGTLQVTLEEVTPIESESGRELELVFYTYNSASGSAYKTWFGISP